MPMSNYNSKSNAFVALIFKKNYYKLIGKILKIYKKSISH